MIEKIITSVTIGVVISILFRYLQKATARPVSPSDTGYLLRLNKFYAVIAVISLFLGLIIAAMLVLGEEYILAPMPLLLFWLPGLFCFLYYKNHSLRFDDNTLEVKSWLGKQESIQWADIQNISFSHLHGLIVVTDRYGVKVKIHQHLVGLTSFVNTMERKTTWTAKELKLPIQY